MKWQKLVQSLISAILNQQPVTEDYGIEDVTHLSKNPEILTFLSNEQFQYIQSHHPFQWGKPEKPEQICIHIINCLFLYRGVSQSRKIVYKLTANN